MGSSYFEPSLTFVRLSVRVVREPENAEKSKKGTQNHYISRVCGGAPAQPIVVIFGTARDLSDIIDHAKSCIDRFRGFGPSKSQSLGLPKQAQWPLTLCLALTCTHVVSQSYCWLSGAYTIVFLLKKPIHYTGTNVVRDMWLSFDASIPTSIRGSRQQFQYNSRQQSSIKSIYGTSKCHVGLIKWI